MTPPDDSLMTRQRWFESTRRSMLVAALCLVAANLVVYGRVAGYGFLSLDDDRYVTANPMVLGGLSGKGLIWAFTTFHASNWHPLTWLSHMLDCQLFGAAAGPHHAVSLLIHIASTVVLFLLWTRLTGALLPSFLLAALFSLHPLRVESVAWVAERKDVLGALFWMLTLSAYAAYVSRAARAWYGATLAVFTLGLLAKPMLVSLPLVLLLLDFWPLQRVGRVPARRLIAEKVPLFALALASCLITLAAQSAGGAVKSLEAIPVAARL